jgi:DNA/RNA-binding domain of Phe-tRNA-synthetase-like protein
MHLEIELHPNLEPCCFLTSFSSPLLEQVSPSSLLRWFDLEAKAPLTTNAEVKTTVRDLLRHGGFKPTGRSKPASEYLLKAVEKEWFTPEGGINLAVDACNVVSLHSGLPISVIDIDLAKEPLRIAPCAPETKYPFNASGQIIDVSGLISLHDAEGPCAGPVKDSHRTKTNDHTVNTLSVIWGTTALPGRTRAAFEWYQRLLHDCGATTTVLVHPTPL